MSSKYPPSKPRLRASCDGCFLAKVKCSKARPICTRCLQVGLICRYSPSSRSSGSAGAAGGVAGAGAGGLSGGRNKPSRQLMASTLSDESCEDLGRWLSQQWAAAAEHHNCHGNPHGHHHHYHHQHHPPGTPPMWNGGPIGLPATAAVGSTSTSNSGGRAAQGQDGGATPLASCHSTTATSSPPVTAGSAMAASGSSGTAGGGNNNGSVGSPGLLDDPAVLPSPGWTSYQAPPYLVGPSSPYGSVLSSNHHGFSTATQTPPWIATFEAPHMNQNAPGQNSTTTLPPPPSSSSASSSSSYPPPPQHHGFERFRPQSWSDSSTSVSASSDLPEWTMAYWPAQPEFRGQPFACQPPGSSEHQTWDTNGFMTNHH